MNSENINLAIKLLGGWYILTHTYLLISFFLALPMFGLLELTLTGSGAIVVASLFLLLAGLTGAILFLQHKRIGWLILLGVELFGLFDQLIFYILGGLNQTLSEYPAAIYVAVIGAFVGFAFTFFKIGALWMTRVAFEKKTGGKVSVNP